MVNAQIDFEAEEPIPIYLGVIFGKQGLRLAGELCDGEVTNLSANGVFILVVKIDNYVPLDSFKDRIDRLIRSIKNSPRVQGVEEIFIPGEPEYQEEEKRSKDGYLFPMLHGDRLKRLVEHTGSTLSNSSTSELHPIFDTKNVDATNLHDITEPHMYPH